MNITYELDLSRFEAWSGGEDTIDRILEEGLEEDFCALLEDLYPGGIDETALNDILRFDADRVYESLGMKTDEELEEEEAREREREKMRERVTEAVKAFDDVDDLCDHYGGDCDKCPLCLWSDDCGTAFDEFKGED